MQKTHNSPPQNPFRQGKIFKIVAKCERATQDKEFGKPIQMIGRTTDTLEETFEKVKAGRYCRLLDGIHRAFRKYSPITHYGAECCKIKLLEEFPCDNDAELEAREREWIDLNLCYEWFYLRKNWAAAIRSRVWHAKHSAYKNEYSMQYRIENADRINSRRKSKITCECGATMRNDSKSKHRKSLKHIKAMEAKKTIEI